MWNRRDRRTSASSGLDSALQERISRKMRGTVVTVTVLFGLLLAASGVAWFAWRELAATEISLHGMIAMALGGSISLLLGGGLMWLVFYSSRKGFDDDANHPD